MPPFSTSSARWAAITTRDPSASKAFIYCVTTTKIYCRPTCPARLARRANVVFHDNAADAEVAGYRACMRCRPGEEDESAGDPQRIAVRKACELILDEWKSDGGLPGDPRGGRKWSVQNLAKEVGLTESHFCRVFKKIMGVTIGKYRAQALEKRRADSNEVALRKDLPEVQVVDNPFEFQYSVDGMQTKNSFDLELARDWQEFSGTSDLSRTIDMFPAVSGADFMSFNFSPELLSDASTPAMTDDGMQFLNFDNFDTPTTPCG